MSKEHGFEVSQNSLVSSSENTSMEKQILWSKAE